MKVPLDEAREKVRNYLIKSGLANKDADIVTELVIDQQLVGNVFSAIGELNGKHQRLFKVAKDAKPEIVVDLPSLKLIKANSRPAMLVTHDNIPEMVKRAKQNGISALGIYDSSYNEFLDMLCRKVAAEDCIAILTSNGGPQGVVPHGGKKDILGTNPLAYAVPTEGDPIVFDAATAMHAWGLIRLAKEAGGKLPHGYLDKEGNPTTDPNVANAILPFGGYKGYAINLLMDVLSGALVRSQSGLDVPADDPDRHIGSFMIVIDPAAFGDIAEFKRSTTKLANDLLAVPAADPEEPVRVPGFRGAQRRAEQLNNGYIEVDDEDWRTFTKALEEIDGGKE